MCIRDSHRIISGNSPRNFQEISPVMGGSLGTNNDIVIRQLKNFGHGLHEMNSMIILDSPVEYLENVKSDQK